MTSPDTAKSPRQVKTPPPKYKRVLLKISGEVLMGAQSYGHDQEMMSRICAEVKAVVDMGVEVCLVVGGGNIYRGMSGAAHGMERASADYMGMLATVLNALALQNCLEKIGMDTRVLSAIHMVEVCEPYVRRRAIRHLERGRVVIFAGGNGNPFFTTDTTAALRGAEMGCDLILKGTSVDGVYSADPKKVDSAKRFETLGYQQMLAENLKVMDASAISLARDNNIPIMIFSIRTEGAFPEVLAGRGLYTMIQN